MNNEEQQQQTQETTVSVDAFLKENVKQAGNVKLKLERFSQDFEIKSLSAKDLTDLRKKNTVATFDRRTRQTKKTVDEERLTNAMIVAALVVPDLNNAKLQEAYGTMGDPAGTIQEMLTAGEYADLVNAINEASGFDSSVEEAVDEAKK